MSDWLLDDKEINEVWEKGMLLTNPKGILYTAAKAQDAKTKKKLVEWLEKHNVAPEHPLRHLEISYLNLQALKKEVLKGKPPSLISDKEIIEARDYLDNAPVPTDGRKLWRDYEGEKPPFSAGYV